MIDVLVPVLGRPQNAMPLADNFFAHAPPDATLLFLCSPGDDRQIYACWKTDAEMRVVNWHSRPGDYARKINYGFEFTASRSCNPWVLNGSDDIEFTEGWWDNAQRYVTQAVGVIATNDMANGLVKRGVFGTHCIISRAYINEHGGTCDQEPGVVLYEGYDHNYVDQELCMVAKARGRYAFSKHSIIRHRHPLWRTADWDDTYRKGHARIREDQRLFAERIHPWTSARRDIVRR